MSRIKIAAPAKINLTLEVLDKREDGFHNLKSIMQAISLYDYLTFDVTDSDKTQITLFGNSDKIPYDNKNLVYKAIEKFLEKTAINNKKIEVYIEKNIPVEAGLAGGSTDAAAAFFALNKLFNNPLCAEEIELLCASLGSDLNFCLHGGTALCKGRGEKTKRIPTKQQYVTLIKPLGFGISAKEAYTKFAQMSDKTVPNNTEKLMNDFSTNFLFNSLELAVINDYQELLEIKTAIPKALMSGSGPTFFVLERYCPHVFDSKRFLVIEDLKFITDGVKEIPHNC
ncbi:4-diphosphocytidyl-2-C-methyl-D-erythritol kinase [Clostridium sp. CAG:306]|nr:4-diphosphocytidyl-2-C-methyl-D-erythritol kinase [Clostridium sp. CAG:306]